MSVTALAGLEELDRRFPDRVAWSAEWQESCAWLAGEALALGADLEVDRAGNQWFALRGERDAVVVVGGHLDAGPGCDAAAESLGLVAGLEVLRRLAADGPPPVTVKLVNWVDGAAVRFERPFGASAAAGTLRDWEFAGQLVDRYGSTLNEVAENAGLQLKLVHMARRMLVAAAAYIELGAEPGDGGPLVVAASAAGGERCRVRWVGGDPRAAAERFEAVVSGSVERVAFEPDLAVQLVDLRAPDTEALEGLLDAALEASDRIATEAGLSVEWQRIWAARPVEFAAPLVEVATAALPEAERGSTTLQTGAAEIARGGFRAALLVLRPPLEPGAVALAVDSLEQVVRAVASSC